ncbi:MAG: hypothetical protein JWQ96_1314 [Segetibacter sp.]|nr:hypothetical protein [Segetibacter sp.]
MFSKKLLAIYFPYALASAILFAIPALFFVRDSTYAQSWLLYLGNMLFMLPMIVFMLAFNKKRRDLGVMTSLMEGGHIATVMGVILACLLSLLLLFIYAGGIFQSDGTTEAVLEDAPAQTTQGAVSGMTLFLFMDAVIGNFSAGSFATIILAYYHRSNKRG